MAVVGFSLVAAVFCYVLLFLVVFGCCFSFVFGSFGSDCFCVWCVCGFICVLISSFEVVRSWFCSLWLFFVCVWSFVCVVRFFVGGVVCFWLLLLVFSRFCLFCSIGLFSSFPPPPRLIYFGNYTSQHTEA